MLVCKNCKGAGCEFYAIRWDQPGNFKYFYSVSFISRCVICSPAAVNLNIFNHIWNPPPPQLFLWQFPCHAEMLKWHFPVCRNTTLMLTLNNSMLQYTLPMGCYDPYISITLAAFLLSVLLRLVCSPSHSLSDLWDCRSGRALFRRHSLGLYLCLAVSIAPPPWMSWLIPR